MFHQLRKVIYLVVVLSLLAAGTASANGFPTWVVAFDPGPYMMKDPTGQASYFVHSVEEFKNDLYIVAGDPGWFHWPIQYPGRVFRSPDGMNWQPVTELGFGLGTDDKCGTTNYYDTSWDMTVFQNMLYMLPFDSCYTLPGTILRSRDGVNWESVADTKALKLTWSDESGTYYGQFHKFGIFKGMLYVDVDNYLRNTSQNDSKVFRSRTGNPGTWEEVANFPDWGGPGSFQTFKGGLYIASDGISVIDPTNPDNWIQQPDQIWRTFDGVNWQMVVDGFDKPDISSMGGMLDYKGYLYAGVGYYGNLDPDNPTSGGGQIWRSKDGLQWDPVMMGGFGNSNNEKIDGFGIYLGKLFAYAVNWMEGGSVYRTQDAQTWEQASEYGWGNPEYFTTHHISDQAVFKDEFYMGVLGPQGVLLKMAHPDK